MNPTVKSFFDAPTGTFTYVVYEKVSSPCVIIDSVLNFDTKSGRTSTHSADEVITFVQDQHLEVAFILETHAHADHLTAAPYLKKKLGGKLAIGSHIQDVQKVFKDIFHLEASFAIDGQQFDDLLDENEEIQFGQLMMTSLFVPGHTPACMAYQIGDCVFVGDTMFLPDVGTARCDFPGGDAKTLYQSIQKILKLPPSTRLFMCHDYPPAGRAVQCETTVALQRKGNIHVHDGVSEEDFVKMRTSRDKTLEMPTLILPSVQINIRAGQFPPAESNGVSYLKLPMNLL
jgi:glyoxylase-like metal-dependent hydrolase (beta-lactamase superfamily II)